MDYPRLLRQTQRLHPKHDPTDPAKSGGGIFAPAIGCWLLDVRCWMFPPSPSISQFPISLIHNHSRNRSRLIPPNPTINLSVKSPLPTRQTIWRCASTRLSSPDGDFAQRGIPKLFTIMDALVSVGCQQTVPRPVRFGFQ